MTSSTSISKMLIDILYISHVCRSEKWWWIILMQHINNNVQMHWQADTHVAPILLKLVKSFHHVSVMACYITYVVYRKRLNRRHPSLVLRRPYKSGRVLKRAMHLYIVDTQLLLALPPPPRPAYLLRGGNHTHTHPSTTITRWVVL